MDTLRIYKLMSEELHFAFVVAYSLDEAFKIVRDSTTLQVSYFHDKEASEYPYVLEKVKYKPGIYISYILPF